MPKGEVVPVHPNWVPKAIRTSWDDLLDGIKTAADWEAKRKDVGFDF
jgi:hypothetical protein